MSDCEDLLMRREARYVLWALRCAQRAAAGDEEAADRLGEHPETAAITLACDSFIGLVRALNERARIDWHDPDCGCVSAGEMALLHALAESTESLPGEASWWAVVAAAGSFRELASAATDWLQHLAAAGLIYPRPDALIASVTGPMAALIEEPSTHRLQ